MRKQKGFIINDEGVLLEYEGHDKTLIIPDGVKVIGEDSLSYGRGKYVKTVIVPEGVIEIKKYAFSCSKIERITLPKSLKKIGEHAFHDCEKLKSITIPDGITCIENSLFYDSGLEEVQLPAGLQEINHSAFSFCDKLREITLPKSLKKIGEHAFHNCKKLKSITIPDGITCIENSLFYDSGLEEVQLPAGLQEINHSAFSFCDKLREITLPKSLKKIGEGTFYNCEKLKSITIPDGITCIENSLFCHSGLEEVQLPAGLKKINQQAFMNCSNLKKINLPDLDTIEIGEQAFTGCESMVDKRGMLILQNRLFTYYQGSSSETSVILPDGLKAIESWESLDYNGKVNVQMNIKCPAWKTRGSASVYGRADSIIMRDGTTISFRDDTGCIVAKVVLAIEGETEPKENGAILSIRLKNGSFDFVGYDAHWAKLAQNPNKIRVALARLQYPYELSDEMRGVYEDYLAKRSFPAGQLLIDEGNTVMLSMLADKQMIAKSAFPKLVDYASSKNKVEMTAILLAAQHTSKQKPAAKKEAKPKQKSLWKKPKPGTHQIGRYLGTDTHVVFPLEIDGVPVDGIANTAGEPPENYKSITSVIIPEGYTSIGNRAFAGCENLQTISLPASLREIGTQAFADCTNLKEIFIRKEVSFVGNDVFSGAKIGLLLMETEKGTKIPGHLFFGCKIKDLVIVGGPFKCSINAFYFSGATVAGNITRVDKNNFPDAVYTNEDFTTPDLKGTGGANAKRIHLLADFDETRVLDAAARDFITAEKSRSTNVVNNAQKVAETVRVESIDFANSIFVLHGQGLKSDYFSRLERRRTVQDDIVQRGGTVQDGVSSKMNYLVLPEYAVIIDSTIKKVMALQAKGKPISIINAKECKRHMRLLDVQ